VAERDPEISEADLLRRLRTNDPGAFEFLVRRHGPRLLSVTRRFCGNEADAQDALQDAFISVFKSLGTFHGESQFATWLHTVAVRASLMRLRSKRRVAAAEEPIDELLPKYLADGHRATPGPAWSAASDVELQRQETRELVRRCIQHLPETYRTVMLLRDIEEFDTAETARLLSVSENVVKVRLHRARQALRELLDPYMQRGRSRA
jgi:RNA polymerase sigma-70 factor (ECF subfamily)